MGAVTLVSYSIYRMLNLYCMGQDLKPCTEVASWTLATELTAWWYAIVTHGLLTAPAQPIKTMVTYCQVGRGFTN